MVTLGQSSNFRALIVDDDEIVRRVVARALAEEGFECERTFSGENALHLLTVGERYDLLVTDLRMPGKNGHSLSVEALQACPQLVVIVHTGIDEPRLAKDLIFRGVDDVISKPTNYRVFAAKARGHVARRRQLGDSALEALRPQHAAPRRDPATDMQNRGHDATQFENDPVSADEVERRLEEIDHLFPLSNVAFDVYSMATRDDCEPEDMAATIEQDASLTAEVLRLANSSQSHARYREIDSVEQAIVRLGRHAVGQLALSAGGRQALAGHDLPWIDRDVLWRRSVASTIALRTLKATAGSRADTAEALSTLLHPVGRIVLATLFPDQHRQLVDRCRESGESLDAAERKSFGLSHGQVGARLLSSWGVAPDITHPLQHVTAPFTRLQHHPESIRNRIENAKLSVLLAQIATCCWEPWDTIDLPSTDVLSRLGVETIAQTLESIRRDAACASPASGTEAVAPHAAPAEQARLKVVYRTRGASELDLMPSLLSSLGVHVHEGGDKANQPVVINGLYRGPGLERLIASEDESRVRGIVREKQAGLLFAPGAAVVLPTSMHGLLESLRMVGSGTASGSVASVPAV